MSLLPISAAAQTTKVPQNRLSGGNQSDATQECDVRPNLTADIEIGNKLILPTPSYEHRKEPHHEEVLWMSQRWDDECGHKIAHYTFASAIDHFKALLGKPMHPGSRISIYRCRWCDWFHLGHTHEKLQQSGNRHQSTVFVAIDHVI